MPALRVPAPMVAKLRHHDDAWVALATSLGFGIRRSSEAWVSYADNVIQISPDAELDPDDTLAQIIFHELCHWLTEGEASREYPDWGLDNIGDGDLMREYGTIALQAHWAQRHGLRDVLVPTTDFHAFFLTLKDDPLETGEAGEIGLEAWERIQNSEAFLKIDRALATLAAAVLEPSSLTP